MRVTPSLIAKNDPFFSNQPFPAGTVDSPEGEAAKNSREFFSVPKGCIPLTPFYEYFLQPS